MSQAWLQVIGLILDIVGFALLALEWLLAQRAESAIRAIEEARERQDEGAAQIARTMKDPHPSFQLHWDMMAQNRRRLAKTQLGTTRSFFERHRYGAIYAGMVCVLIGFLLQLMSAWPGCCTMLGITPIG
ncbi:MAG: hypothetical protein ACREC6_01360 [Hyphomicrobiaceae bacterium]